MLVYVPTIRPTSPTIMKKIFLIIVNAGNLSLYRTQISIIAGHMMPNTGMHKAPTKLMTNPMNGIAAATAPKIQSNLVCATKRSLEVFKTYM